jgi:hypothetical protein
VYFCNPIRMGCQSQTHCVRATRATEEKRHRDMSLTCCRNGRWSRVFTSRVTRGMLLNCRSGEAAPSSRTGCWLGPPGLMAQGSHRYVALSGRDDATHRCTHTWSKRGGISDSIGAIHSGIFCGRTKAMCGVRPCPEVSGCSVLDVRFHGTLRGRTPLFCGYRFITGILGGKRFPRTGGFGKAFQYALEEQMK